MKELLRLPSPSNISYSWSGGSILGLSLIIQIISGIFLTFQYTTGGGAFDMVERLMEDVSGGWVIRFAHANGASLFFMSLYFHMGRGLYYKSFLLWQTWVVGMSIYVLAMATAFLGYVLPWGQMSFWGATVITNLLSSIPYIGLDLVEWVWGGFSVGAPTLTRFFSLHYLLPFVITVLVMAHLFFLHSTGSTNPLGLPLSVDKVEFHPLFSVKDVVGFVVTVLFLSILSVLVPHLFMDPDNFEESNPMRTPVHIQPEWYFLFAYAILRSVPNKLGGVLAMAAAVGFLFLLPLFKGGHVGKAHKLMCVNLFILFLFLTWLGTKPVEPPFVEGGKLASVLYFVILALL
uniref:cytochrome b n=1 Tax=Laemobothrion atrum TaxID=179170 RepID=UPI0025794820|nr:cytochrome b [Laemobothrion atrum]WGU50354.1 cytochrome b [Laemobothrion atrum]